MGTPRYFIRVFQRDALGYSPKATAKVDLVPAVAEAVTVALAVLEALAVKLFLVTSLHSELRVR